MGTFTQNPVQVPAAETSGSKAANAEWLSSDITPLSDSVNVVRLFLSLDKSAIIEFTLDSGSNWFTLKDKASVTANEALILYVPMKPGDNLNFRTTETGGATLNFFRADYVGSETGALGT